jgi:hypothetical protein
MANVNFPRGLQPHEEVLHKVEMKIPAAYNQDLFIWDPVISIATGRDINIATAGTGNPILGSILAIYDSNKDPLQYWDAAHVGEGYVIVADHPMQKYIIQGDGDTSFLDEDDSSGNVNLVAGSGGSTVYYRSSWQLNDSDTGGNTAGDQIRLIRVVDRVDNTIGIANADWICQINNHQQTAGIVGVGV